MATEGVIDPEHRGHGEDFLARADAFKKWFVQGGGMWRQGLEVKWDDEFGIHIATTTTIPDDEAPLLSCPYELVVTPKLSQRIIRSGQQANLGTEDGPALELNERQWVTSFITLHLAYATRSDPEMRAPPPSLALSHMPYVDLLPSLDSLFTPLLLNQAERAMIQGTNLDFAAEQRRDLWESEYHVAKRAVCQGSLSSCLDDFTWNRYLLANTFLTSRGFPSSLLSSTAEPDDQSSLSKPDNEPFPVLLPAIDLLNHKIEEPVTWTTNTEKGGVISFTARRKLDEGEQVYNNYGPKSNEELLMAYGFMVPGNPHSTASVRLGSNMPMTDNVKARLDSAGLRIDQIHHIGVSGHIPEALMQTLRAFTNAQDVQGVSREAIIRVAGWGQDENRVVSEEAFTQELAYHEPRLFAELEALDLLDQLLEVKLEKTKALAKQVRSCEHNQGVRANVWDMYSAYTNEQEEIIDRLRRNVQETMTRWETDSGWILGTADDDEV